MDRLLFLATALLMATPLAQAEGMDPGQFGGEAVGGGPVGGFDEAEPNIGGLGGEEDGGAGAPDLDGDGVPDAFDLDSPGGLGAVPPNQQGVGMQGNIPGAAPVGMVPPPGTPPQMMMQQPGAMNGMAGGMKPTGDPEMDALTPEEKRVFELIEMYHKKQSKARG